MQTWMHKVETKNNNNWDNIIGTNSNVYFN
jgi:hypothetical protein